MRFLPWTRSAAESPPWTAEPFLHVDRDRIYNPLTDRSLRPGDEPFVAVERLARGRSPARLSEEQRESLIEQGWVLPSQDDPGRCFRLKFVEIEARTTCNQACNFCPVSVEPRDSYAMPMTLYENIVAQLVPFRDTIEAVMMLRYNEPTADARFLDQARVIRSFGLPIGLNTNATGLTAKRVDALIELGGLRFLSVNLSTLDRERYKQERRRDHLPQVMRNLDYVKDQTLAEQMVIAVLGRGDAIHEHDFASIRSHFAGSLFEVESYEVMDRAGHLDGGLKPSRPHRRLRGCEQCGSRPLQWLHVTPQAKCGLCCEDYKEQYVVGDLTRETVAEVLSGERFAEVRRWVYGLEEAPEDFICRRCIFARTP